MIDITRLTNAEIDQSITVLQAQISLMRAESLARTARAQADMWLQQADLASLEGTVGAGKALAVEVAAKEASNGAVR